MALNGLQTDPSMPGGIGSALLLLGDQWNLLILQQAFLRHVRRFADWRDALGMADSVLSTRIRELVAAGVLTPAEYRTSGRGRTEYLLTPKGLPLWEFLVAIWAWEQAWSETDDRSARLLHLPCHASIVPELGCRSCAQFPLTARQTSVVIGPDATFGNVAVPRHHRRTVRDRARIEHTYQGQTLEILGDRWSTVLLVAAFLRVRRFADFQHATRHCARSAQRSTGPVRRARRAGAAPRPDRAGRISAHHQGSGVSSRCLHFWSTGRRSGIRLPPAGSLDHRARRVRPAAAANAVLHQAVVSRWPGPRFASISGP